MAAEGGRTSGLLDEGLDQEEHGVGEREESKGEEEDDDDQQQEVLFDYLWVLVNALSRLLDCANSLDPPSPSQDILNSKPYTVKFLLSYYGNNFRAILVSVHPKH